jgi:hypothetical protein
MPATFGCYLAAYVIKEIKGGNREIKGDKGQM